MFVTNTRQLQDLPEELISIIFEYLSPQHLYQTSLVSKRFYLYSLPRVWRSVDLVDCRTPLDSATANTEGDDPEDEALGDEHDDTPILRKLILLAK